MTRKRYRKLMYAFISELIKQNPSLSPALENVRDLKIQNGTWQTGYPATSYAEAWERTKPYRPIK